MKMRCNRTLALSTATLVALLNTTLIGCSGSETASVNGSVGGTVGLPDYGYGGTENGGAGSNTGGTQAATGGMSAAQTSSSPSTGGSSGAGGSAAETGGNSTASTGGTKATGGRTNGGGSKQTGGTNAAGGANSGGTRASGGSSANIGGTKAAGGTAGGGGTKATGGTTGSAGSRLTGGAPGSGGSKSTGGLPGTGGASAAAGSSSTDFDWGTNTYDPAGGQAIGHQGHNTGQGCLASCHSHRFTVGGTVYQSNGTTTAANVEIGVLIGGTLYTGYSGSQGNFYFSGVPSSANWASAQIAIRTATGTAVHPTTSGLSGNCNSCHGSSNRIVVP